MGFRLGIGFDPRDLWRSVRPRGTSAGQFIYVIGDPYGCSKVGVSGNPLQRLAELQTGHPHRLELAWCAFAPEGAYPLEAMVKRTTEHLRTSGGDEWLRTLPYKAIMLIQVAAGVLQVPIQPVQPTDIPNVVAAMAETRGDLPKWRPLAMTVGAGFLLLWGTAFLSIHRWIKGIP